jgi:hypothetical protein
VSYRYSLDFEGKHNMPRFQRFVSSWCAAALVGTALVSAGSLAASAVETTAVETTAVETTTVETTTATTIDPAGLSGVVPRTDQAVTSDVLPTTQIDGVAWDQEVVGNTVYVAGKFTTARPAGSAPGVNTVPRSNLLAYNLTTGELIPGFNHILNAQSLVITASPDKSRIYFGGDFTTVDGLTRKRLAAFDTTTGSLISNFAPNVGYQVRAIAATATTVYIGGTFGGIGVNIRNNIAALSTPRTAQ